MLYGSIDYRTSNYYASSVGKTGNKIGDWDGTIAGIAKGDRLVEMVSQVGSNFLLPSSEIVTA